MIGSFSVLVKVEFAEEGSFWLTSMYGPNKTQWRKDFWMELQDLYGLACPKWCIGGDFNVIRRPVEKLGGSRLTLNMRCFDELIRELELFDPPLRNAYFTWSNMQHVLICKRLDRFYSHSSGIIYSLIVPKRLYQDGLMITIQFVWILTLLSGG